MTDRPLFAPLPDDPDAETVVTVVSVRLSDGAFSIGSDLWPGVSKLIEEMGELGQVLGKLIATRGASRHWDGSDLRQRLIEEMGDVKAALAFVASEMSFPDRDRIDERAEAKLHLFWGWQAGQVDGAEQR